MWAPISKYIYSGIRCQKRSGLIYRVVKVCSFIEVKQLNFGITELFSESL